MELVTGTAADFLHTDLTDLHIQIADLHNQVVDYIKIGRVPNTVEHHYRSGTDK